MPSNETCVWRVNEKQSMNSLPFCLLCVRQVDLCVSCAHTSWVWGTISWNIWRLFCGLPAWFPEVCLANFLLLLGRILFFLYLLWFLKKPRKPSTYEKHFFSKKHSCKCSVGEWTSKLFPILISVFEHGEGSLCLRGLPYSCSIVHLRVPCDCGAKLCWWMLLAS